MELDGETELDMPSPKRMRLEPPVPEVTHSMPSLIDRRDDSIEPSPSSLDAPKLNQQSGTSFQGKAVSSEGIKPFYLPGLGLLDGDSAASNVTGGPYPQNNAAMVTTSIAASDAEKLKVGDLGPGGKPVTPVTEDKHEITVDFECANVALISDGTEDMPITDDAQTVNTLSQNVPGNAGTGEGKVAAGSMGKLDPDVNMDETIVGTTEVEVNIGTSGVRSTGVGESRTEDTEPTVSTGIRDESGQTGIDVAAAGNDNERDCSSSTAIGDIMQTDQLATTFQDLAEANKSSGDAEFELDSSPYQSSSSDISSDTSSSDDSDNDSDADDYEMLSPEEEARRLMAEDGAQEGKVTADIPRTLNEKPDEIIPKPDLTISADMKLEELGEVQNLVENLAIIKANTSGEYRVLDAGSVLCLEDRTVIGVIGETLGQVQQPFYTVRFTNPAAISEAGVSQSTKIYYVAQYAAVVLTQGLKAFKGSDASNLHDEEVGDDELEFSDDEAEAEHKRQVKSQKRARYDAKHGQEDGFSRGPQQRPMRPESNSKQRSGTWQEHPPNSAEPSLNYDDAGADSEELYTPLARPSNLHEMMVHKEDPPTNFTNHGHPPRGGRGRGRGDRGEGRGRNRGGRGNGRAGNHDRRGQHSSRGNGPSHAPPNAGSNHSPGPPSGAPSIIPGSSLPPRPSPPMNGFQSHPQTQHASMPPPSYPAQQPPQTHSHPNYPSQQPPSYSQMYPQPYQQPQYSPNSYPQGMPYQSYGPQQPFSPSPQYSGLQTSPMTMPSAAIPAGAHINPNFFRQQAQNPPQAWQQRQGHAVASPQQYQQYQQASPANSNMSPLGQMSPDAARRLQENLNRLKDGNGAGGAQG